MIYFKHESAQREYEHKPESADEPEPISIESTSLSARLRNAPVVNNLPSSRSIGNAKMNVRNMLIDGLFVIFFFIEIDSEEKARKKTKEKR